MKSMADEMRIADEIDHRRHDRIDDNVPSVRAPYIPPEFKSTKLNMSISAYFPYSFAREAIGFRDVNPFYTAIELMDSFDAADKSKIVFW
jgi:hypothetical protein